MSLQGNVEAYLLQFCVSRTQFATDKKCKATKIKEIISAACALLNSGSGTIKLQFENDEKTSRKHVDDLIRIIEQRVIEMAGITTVSSHLEFKIGLAEIAIAVKKSSKLITISYNMYLPSNSQVIIVPATTPIEDVRQITQRRTVDKTLARTGYPKRRYVKGRSCGLTEGADVEMKNLKASSSKSVTLADRITGKSNKLTSYVSAFANSYGGHVYYGLDDEGIVEGEEISEKQREEIIKKVTKTINKMVWSEANGKPERGKQWGISFESVLDSTGNQLPSTFVIEIYVAPCLGGVFTEEPESYHLVQGKVQKMDFQSWWARINEGLTMSGPITSVPSHVSCLGWSSKKDKTLFRILQEKLLQHRNDEDMTAFKLLSKLAKERFPETNVKLIVLAEKIAVAYKRYDFEKAERRLKKFKMLLSYSTDADSNIFKLRMLQLMSMIERSKENYTESFKMVEEGLRIAEQAPTELYKVWFYIEAAMNKIIMSAEKGDMQMRSSARNCLEMAERDANLLGVFSSRNFDLQQKLHIYKASTLLGCPITGDIAKDQDMPSFQDIQTADAELASVWKSVLQGSPCSHFRKIQYLLAKCDLFRRRSEVQEEDKALHLRQAFGCGSEARILAQRHRFWNMADYAKRRLSDLTEKLVREAIQTRG